MNPPLQGRTILITRSRQQSGEFRRQLEQLGAEVLEIPTIEICPLQSGDLDSALRKIGEYDWLIFTSVNGVEIFVKRAHQLSLLLPGGETPKICAIGPATAGKIESYGYPVELLPGRYQAEGILEDFLHYHHGHLNGLRILLPRARQARELLPQQLRRHGAKVVVLPVYDTVTPADSRRKLCQGLKRKPPDLVTFTSPSTVHNFIALANSKETLKDLCYAAIGPITAAAARSSGLPLVLQANHSTIQDLVSAIEGYFSTAQPTERPK